MALPFPRLLPAALLLLGALAGGACSSNTKQATAPAAGAAAPARPDSVAIRRTAQAFRVQYQPPQVIDSSQYLYQPLMVVQLPNDRPLITIEDGLRTSAQAATNYDSARGPVFNLLFYHLPTGRTHLLFPSGEFRIERVDANHRPVRRWPYIFYQIIPADRNQDGELTPADGRVLFVSDKAGEQLRQLTPDSARLERWQLVTGTDLLLAELRYDSDRNGKFNDADANYWLRCNLRAPQAAATLFAPDSIEYDVQQQMLRRQSLLRAAR